MGQVKKTSNYKHISIYVVNKIYFRKTKSCVFFSSEKLVNNVTVNKSHHFSEKCLTSLLKMCPFSSIRNLVDSWLVSSISLKVIGVFF